MDQAQFSGERSDQLWNAVKDIRTAMLTTREQDGTLRGRPMATQQARSNEDGSAGVLWFFCKIDSAKAHEIENESQVQVSYVDKGFARFISVSGTATVNQDRGKIDELWHDDLDQWFQNGKEDPEVGLIRVSVSSADYWSGPASKMNTLFENVKEIISNPFEPHVTAKAKPKAEVY